MIWQMDISQGSVLVSVFCLTRCNYKQCCLFAHSASGYPMSGLALSSPHVIRCHMRLNTRPGGGNHWNGILFEMRIWSRLTMAGNLVPGVWVLVILMWPIWQHETRTFHHTQISIRATVPSSDLHVSNHIPILIHASSRPIIRLFNLRNTPLVQGLYHVNRIDTSTEKAYVIKWTKSFQKSYLGF